MKISFIEVEPNIQIVDNSPILFLKDINAIVIADLHLGIEAIMQEEGSFIPQNLTSQIIEKVTYYLKEIKPNMLILNGDVKHSFQEPTKIENRDVKEFINKIHTLVSEVHIIKGNHDIFLSWALKGADNVMFHTSSLSVSRYYFIHGDKDFENDLTNEIEYIIIGHLHPVLETKINGLQKVRNPTFLLGPLKGSSKKILVLPAFTEYSSGCPIHPKSQGHYIVPILRDNSDIQNFELYVLGESEVFHFPELRLWM